MNGTGLWAKLSNELAEDPFLALALAAALVAIATTPIAFAVLGRMDWFRARRGRTMQKPEFASIVCGMMLVMAIPAIFAAMVLKSRTFDRNRYEFDPNRTWSVLEQGRGFKSVQEADAAVKKQMEYLAGERKKLVDGLKKLDESMLALRAVAGTSPAVAQAVPGVLQSLAGVRASVGLEGPQQLMDFTAPPVSLAAAIPAGMASPGVPGTAMVAAPAAAPTTGANAAPTPAVPAGSGLSPQQVAAEIAAVPEPQKGIAAMIPLADVPAGWTPGKSGDKYIETFNAENLYEKIDGRAESFTQYNVKGMAYAFYHPTGDPSNEVQLYVFEMSDPLKALGKYGAEKPDEAKVIQVGDEGYTAAGSTLFYASRYYTQIVSTADDPKFAAFALELARKVAEKQKPGSGGASSPPATAVASADPEGEAAAEPTKAESPKPEASKPAASAASAEVTPATYFALLPKDGKQGDNKYVAQDVFGYSFLSDVFMADYKEGEATWQGFLRPYRDDKEAKEMLEKYRASVKQDGAEIKELKADGADEFIVTSNIGLFDVVFRKGNTLAGANGGTTLKPAEDFARAFAKSMPAKLQVIGGK
ncbi:hypothetical protein OJF2_43910 [Aquisphaera giovannonii]|uniref:Uncharacterized protein n=1 Tax=Aquisphaera giovannonii TaxID=406548 RepID=A0A5B9W6I7_9BACT|nr:DUF6599 family protein [Aquisphaera giovannonii]QEH35834.1 hypothetical protein OJF2_43910 [Aquisphaera giovannonii]